MTTARVSFVCLGNICRSPMAAAVMRRLVAERGLDGTIAVDSAGTGGWHTGDRADERARAALRRSGYADDLVARQFRATDFDRFDVILGLDAANVRDLTELAPTAEAAAKVQLLRSFDAAADPGAEVPDPYYGSDAGFDEVLRLIEPACAGLLDALVAGAVP